MGIIIIFVENLWPRFALCWACIDQSCTDHFFFFRIRGFLFSVYWAFFFLVGLPITKFFFFQILDQNFFGLFFFLVGLLKIFLRVFLILIKDIPIFSQRVNK